MAPSQDKNEHEAKSVSVSVVRWVDNPRRIIGPARILQLPPDLLTSLGRYSDHPSPSHGIAPVAI
ncbi:hypothetical protein VM1G_11730 [Cytospora mali]|uniref:Uncharacterized protein n=1 Tax=Cytospora mali TaxID=578113 RepID=A0A194W612_CYTMA|nr:hypothetical protein VM1G_11730 [Valsa mali]